MNSDLQEIQFEEMTGEQIRQLRGQYNLTQEEFAKKFGISVETLQEWESR